MAKPSRRALFRGVFKRAGFELQHDTANEVLMRLNQSLDPIPLTDGMWAAYVAIRRGLRDFSDLPEHVAKDLAFLLRVETILQAWIESAAADASTPGRMELRDRLITNVGAEIRRYLNNCEETEAYRREVRGPVIRCLSRAAGIPVPSELTF